MISCRRAFIDADERTITLPETKNGTQHCFPYGKLTADICEAIPRFNSTDLLFPGRDVVSPWNGSGKAKWELITADKSELPPIELVEAYLKGTPFVDLLLAPVSFHIPMPARFQHHWIVAPPGTGAPYSPAGNPRQIRGTRWSG